MYNFSNMSTIYVSPSKGNDIHMGFLPEDDGYGNGPMKTISYALFQIANMRRVGAMQPITMKLLDDEIFLDKTIEINEEVCDVTIEPNDMAKRTMITGSRRITGFYESEYNGVKCYGPDGCQMTDEPAAVVTAKIGGIPVIARTMMKFEIAKTITDIIVVAKPENQIIIKEIAEKYGT